MSVLIPLIALSVVVFIHELGHLLAARASGIGVSHFAIGFGPILGKFTWKHITYSIRALPFGGFVRIKGLDADEAFSEQPKALSFYEASLLKRIFTLVAGSFANILLGFVLFLTIFLTLGNSEALPIIEEALPGSPAFTAGLQPGDKLIEINGQEIKNAQELSARVVDGKPISLTLLRGKDLFDVTLQPTIIAGQTSPKVGIRFQVARSPISPLQALQRAAIVTWVSIKEVGLGLKMLVTGSVELKDMSGPIGIMQFASFGLALGLLQFFGIIAKISISLGVLNLLPIPILDGGHVMIQIFEKLIGRRLSPRFERIMSTAALAILMALMIGIAINDILSWNTRVDLLETLKK